MKKLNIVIIIISLFIINNKINAYNEFKTGNKINYNNIDFYVIKDSNTDEDSVTLLKTEPLTVEEVNLYGGVGTENNHVNMHTKSIPLYYKDELYYQTARDCGGYGCMQYYSGSNCGFNDPHYLSSECKSDYASSEIKYVVDAWVNAKINSGDLEEARLLTYDEYAQYMEQRQICTESCYEGIGSKYDWMHDKKHWIWIGTPYNDSSSDVWIIYTDGSIGNTTVYDTALVRPVIELKKSAIKQSDDEIIVDNNSSNNDNSNNDNVEDIINVVVPNTMQVMSLIFIVIGIVLIVIAAVLIIIKKLNKNR